MRKVFITGGSRGLGFELAKLYKKQGASVAVCSRSDRPQDFPEDIFYFKADVRDAAQLNDVVTSFAKGHLDLCIACAGLYEKDPSTSFQKSYDILKTNIHGTMNAFDSSLSMMMNKGQGQLVAISSFLGLFDKFSTYAQSKGSLISICESYQRALKSTPGIEVTCLLPGYIKTKRLIELNQGNLSRKIFMMEPEEAALSMYHAIEKKESLVIMPSEMKWIAYFLLLCPRFLRNRLISLFSGRH